jgi:hypothetical protein
MYITELKLDNVRTFVDNRIEFVHPDQNFAARGTRPEKPGDLLPRPSATKRQPTARGQRVREIDDSAGDRPHGLRPSRQGLRAQRPGLGSPDGRIETAEIQGKQAGQADDVATFR